MKKHNPSEAERMMQHLLLSLAIWNTSLSDKKAPVTYEDIQISIFVFFIIHYADSSTLAMNNITEIIHLSNKLQKINSRLPLSSFSYMIAVWQSCSFLDI